MADLKAEQIMAAVLTVVTGLTTTGANVQRDRIVSSDVNYSLSVEQGEDVPVEELGGAFIDSLLNVSVVAFVKQTAAYSTRINLIRKEVYAAVMADRTLGLAFVKNVVSLGASNPEAEAGLEKPVVRMAINFQVLYRHSITNAST